MKKVSKIACAVLAGIVGISGINYTAHKMGYVELKDSEQMSKDWTQFEKNWDKLKENNDLFDEDNKTAGSMSKQEKKESYNTTLADLRSADTLHIKRFGTRWGIASIHDGKEHHVGAIDTEKINEDDYRSGFYDEDNSPENFMYTMYNKNRIRLGSKNRTGGSFLMSGDVALSYGTVSHIGQQSGKNNIITTLSTDGKDAARIDYKKGTQVNTDILDDDDKVI